MKVWGTRNDNIEPRAGVAVVLHTVAGAPDLYLMAFWNIVLPTISHGN